MVDIAGTVPERFTKVADALARSIDDGADIGGSVAIVIDGEMVADFWGGHADEARTRPWEQDTIVNVWSTTKTMSALTALVLADRGLLDLDAPVARVLAGVRRQRQGRRRSSSTCCRTRRA